MRSAIIAALVAALVSSGGTYAALRIDGRAIRPHSIPLNRLAEPPNPHLARIESDQMAAPHGFGTVVIKCPNGGKVVSGGFRSTAKLGLGQWSAITRVADMGSGPVPQNTGWAITYQNEGLLPTIVSGYAICLGRN